MPEEELKKLIEKNIYLSEKIYESLEKQRKIRKWTLIITIVVIVLPLIVAMVSLPWMLSNLETYYGDILSL